MSKLQAINETIRESLVETKTAGDTTFWVGQESGRDAEPSRSCAVVATAWCFLCAGRCLVGSRPAKAAVKDHDERLPQCRGGPTLHKVTFPIHFEFHRVFRNMFGKPAVVF